eukprot:TRINITY_DN12096_c0_g1_i1.p1 TRINITY_DN12096_c0_g1~~TRINITY_DN12096_c0_g1_i1.p1  ORF type:complete len:351 (+),score=136.19 TRINITY_DN12096_c0_g1_i1:157-1053(+)
MQAQQCSHEVASSMRELVRVYARDREQQLIVNQRNERLHGHNLLLNIMNVSKSRRLARQLGDVRADIERGKAIVEQIEHAMSEQRRKIESVEDNVQAAESRLQEQGQHIGRIESTLEQDRQQVQRSIGAFEEQLARHQRDLRDQQRKLAAFIQARMKVDFGIDCSFAVISWWVSKSGIVRFLAALVAVIATLPIRPVAPVRTLATLRRVATMIVRSFVWWYCFYYMRFAAAKLGVHALIGTPTAYKQVAADAARDASTQCIGAERTERLERWCSEAVATTLTVADRVVHTIVDYATAE